MKVLGITGGVGAGKSMVLSRLESQYGAAVLECDRIAKGLQEPGGACFDKMVQLMGRDCVRADGKLDRAAVAAKVFADAALLKKLNGLVHPAVKTEVIRLLEEQRSLGRQRAVIEAAILLEDHYEQLCDCVWYIYADEKTRSDRLMKNRGYTKQRIRDMMSRQKDDGWYRSRCDYVIDNSSDHPEDTFRQIEEGLRVNGLLYDREREQR